VPDLPYMPYYHGEFSRWGANLSRIQRHMLFDLSVANFFGGTLPKSPKGLAEICGMTLAAFRLHWPAIRKHFVPGDGGWQNPRIMELREKALNRKGGQSRGGKITAEKNRQRNGPEHVGAALIRWTDQQKMPPHGR